MQGERAIIVVSLFREYDLTSAVERRKNFDLLGRQMAIGKRRSYCLSRIAENTELMDQIRGKSDLD